MGVCLSLWRAPGIDVRPPRRIQAEGGVDKNTDKISSDPSLNVWVVDLILASSDCFGSSRCQNKRSLLWDLGAIALTRYLGGLAAPTPDTFFSFQEKIPFC